MPEMPDFALPFGGASSHAAERLREAYAAWANPDEAERLIGGVLASTPETLPAYFALYKLYFRQSRLGEAEAVARLALNEAARQGGFPADWHALESHTAPWTAVDSPAHFYLFSLKALAFILLRQGRGAESGPILDKLDELDPSDCVGASVIRAYAAGAAMGEPRPA